MPDEHDKQRPGPHETPPGDEGPENTMRYLSSEFADDEAAPPQDSAPHDSGFHTDDYLVAEYLTSREPRPSEEDTADMPPVGVEGEPPAPQDAAPKQDDRHNLPTMPLPFEENVTDPRHTLAGSDGLDPNPDFTEDEPQHTVPHIVPFQHTLVHVPPDQDDEPRNKPQPQEQKRSPQRPPLPPQDRAYTQPNQARPPQQTQGRANPYAPPGTYPTAPQGPYGAPPVPGAPSGKANQLPKRKTARKRTILGCSPGCLMVLAGVLVTFCGGLTLITLVMTATLGTRLEEQLEAQVARVDDYRNFQSTFYFDRDGALLYESFGEGRRTNVQYEDFPQDLINATVAVEDDSFWANPGFEMQATMRAFLQYVGLAQGDSGGSTITQQLVRNVLFDFEYRAERSVQRKIEEILLAVLLSRRKEKTEILEMYLNEIYYGNLAYGAEAAAQVFFGKEVGQLTLGEAALLAGLPQAPANLDPLNPDPEVQAAVAQRWRLVLDRMVSEGYITDQQRDDALAQGYTFVSPDVSLEAPHFTVYAQQQFEGLMTRIGYTPEDVARGGWQVYTTLDLALNDMVQQAARSQVASLAANNVTNAAVIVLKPITGEILAMVGSVDYNNAAIDGNVNVTISPRQPGSTMKPFTYSAALEMGFTPGDIIWDTQTEIAGYRPVNYDGVFHGPVRLRTALANSYNVPAVQTLRLIGVENLLAMMQRFGVGSLGSDASQFGLSLTLGGGEVTLRELTQAYSVFANGGALVPTTPFLCVLDNNDTIVYEYEDSCPKGNPGPRTVVEAGYGQQIIDPRISYIITDILADNVARTPAMGANSPLNTGNIPAAVKTGTTNDIKDNWTVGYTRNVAVGVWVGNSNGDPMVNSSGLTGAAPIWNSVITGIYNNQALLEEFAVAGQLQPDRPEPPSGLTTRQLCDLGQLRDPVTDCSPNIREWFLEGPAGVPDGSGGLYYPQQAPPPPNNPPPTGPWLQEVQPDIYRVLVQPIPPEIAAQIQFNVSPGQVQPPPPLYCQVPIEAASAAPGAREQLFIGPPPDASDAARAEQYARSSGIAFLPTIACDTGLLSVGPVGPSVITAVITSPSPGQVISGAIPVIGTAQFSPAQALYYKVEITGGQFGNNWVTIGDTHNNAVVNGQLEYLAALPPGSYQVRLVVVGHDGNFVQPPYAVPFSVQ